MINGLSQINLELSASKYISEPMSGCWIWLGQLNYAGYAMGKHDGTYRRSHRWAYEKFRGPIPEGLLCLHTCDEPRCCNPTHLYLGTHKDNARDVAEREPEKLTYWLGKTQSEEHRRKNSEGVKKARQLKKW